MASKGKSQSGLSTRVTETSENQRVRHAEDGVVDVSLSLLYSDCSMHHGRSNQGKHWHWYRLREERVLMLPGYTSTSTDNIRFSCSFAHRRGKSSRTSPTLVETDRSPQELTGQIPTNGQSSSLQPRVRHPKKEM